MSDADPEIKMEYECSSCSTVVMQVCASDLSEIVKPSSPSFYELFLHSFFLRSSLSSQMC